MKSALVLLLLAVFQYPCSAAYTYYQTYNGTTSGFTQNGSLTNVSTPYGPGVTSSASTGGSLISSVAVPDGSVNYEAVMTLGIAHSGVTYTVYMEASPNTLGSSSSATGSFWWLALTPTIAANGSCSANLTYMEQAHGTTTWESSMVIPCRNGMTLHVATATYGSLVVYGDNTPYGVMLIHRFYYMSGGATQSDGTPLNPVGTAGFGIGGAPAGSTTDYIANLRVGSLDRVDPNPVTGATAYVQSNRVDIHANGTTDDANGIGMGWYYIVRNGQTLFESPTPDFADTTVQPGTQYQYTIFPDDWHYNPGPPVVMYVTTLPSGAVEARETGIRPTGTYWGGTGEQVDVLFGNLNYSLPLIAAQGRGWTVPLTLSYNSQNWVQDASGYNWQFGNDNGFGYGWNLQVGVIRKYSLADWSADYYEFRDSSGAVYRLNQNNNGIWTSSESLYVWFDSNANVLHFANGNFWYFGCMSALGEQDAGDMYPTVIEDSNGNQVTLTYDTGIGATWSNSSARVVNVADVRGSAYSFSYASVSGAAAPRYLTQINNNLATGESFTLNYSSPTQLTSPINASYTAETTVLLTGITNNATGLTTSLTYDPSGSGELDKVTFPYGGYFRWTYANETYAANRTVREVANRYLLWDTGIGERAITFSRDPGDSSRNLPLYRQATDAHANAVKTWYPNASRTYTGLIATFNESSANPSTLVRQTTYAWSQDTTGNSYIGSLQQTTDPSSNTPVTKRTDQVLDSYGNVTQSNLYDYGNLSSPSRVYNNSYLSGTNYSSQYIFNRLVTSTVTPSGGSALTLVTNTYDTAAPSDAPGITQHDSAYGTSFLYRGNVTSSVSFGNTQQSTYDITGTAVTLNDGVTTHTITTTTGTATNYSAPSAITTANSLTTSVAYDAQLNTTGITNPNGGVASSVYDSSSRPTSTTSPYGAVTNYSYSTSAPQVTTTTGSQWTQTTYDGLGRTKRVAQGYGSTTLSYTDTIYDTCGCTPTGKPYQTSVPYAPGSTPAWKVNTYDAIGRTLTTVAPDGASTTNYSYAGNVVTITDPAGKWKQYTTDAYGQLIQVLEPSPNPSSEPNHVTTYTFDVLGHLIQAQMPRTINGQVTTQTRTWTYDPTTQFLTQTTTPEAGTTTFTYNSDGTLATKTDAKSQQIQYTYDPYGRLIQIARGVVSNGTFTENLSQRTTLTYDGANGGFSSNTAGLLSSVAYSAPHGLSVTEMYSYHAAGAVTAKRMQLSGTALSTYTANLDATYTYNSLGQVSSVQYPFAAWSNGAITSNGPQYGYSYDSMNRLNAMTANSQTLVSNVSYGPANQMLQLNWIGFTETRTYNSNLQLTELVSGSYHFKYNYSATQNNGRIGSMTDVVSGESVAYTYDSLNRLTQASGTGDPTGSWSQSFAYDGFGNLVGKTGANAPSNAFLNTDPTTNRLNAGGAAYDGNGNLTAYGTGSSAATYAYDIENRLSTATPLPGGNQVVYAYDNANQRVYQGTYASSTNTYSNEQIYFYGIDGKKLVACSLQTSGSTATISTAARNIWFAGRLIGPGEDRLQSIGKYFPYGEDRYNPNPANPNNDQEKFATYTRDSATLLDYAYQRYYNNQIARFHTPDPYGGSGAPEAPQSWNRYTYVLNDPVAFADPTGMHWETAAPATHCEYTGGSVLGSYWQTLKGCDVQFTLVWVPDPSGPSATSAGSGAGGFSPVSAQSTPQNPCPPGTTPAVTVAGLSTFLGKPSRNGGALAAYAAAFYQYGAQYNIDPRFLAALAGIETSFGKNVTRGANNIFNWLYNGANSPFASITSAIQTVAKGIAGGAAYAASSTPDQLYHHFCDFTRDPTCAHSEQTLDNFLQEQGTTGSESKGFPCNRLTPVTAPGRPSRFLIY